MKTSKITILVLILGIMFICVSCNKADENLKNIKPQISQMKSICELATMECYYHNVAKYTEKDAEGILFWKKDKHFWIEYSGIVKIGIDASLVVIDVRDKTVVITIPEAKVLDKKVDEATLNDNAFIVDKNSASVTGNDQTLAFKEAQNNMVNSASADSALLASAQQRAQTLLEEYVTNIGNAIGKEYSIEWKYVTEDGKEKKDDVEASPSSEAK